MKKDQLKYCCVRLKIIAGVLLIAGLFLVQPRMSLASGFQIPAQSLRAVGIAGATFAYTPGPEASHYNPANMSFLEDAWLLETSLTVLHLPSIEYTDNRSSFYDGSSESEIFYLPHLHFVSRSYNDFRFGFSLVYPYGLAKAWEQPFPAASAANFSLDVIEAAPTFSYSFSEKFSIGGGLRFIYAKGEVENGATSPPFPLGGLTELSRKLEGDDFQVGYSLAATLRPVDCLRFAVTYRSEINLELEGDADLLAAVGAFPVAAYNGAGGLDLTLPAVFSLATSYTYENLTFEVAWSRTYWSAIESFDFQYDQSFMGDIFFDAFDRPLVKNWQDSDALRFGLTWQVNDRLQTTLGFAIDETPIPDRTLGFELPDSDGYMYGIGLNYLMNKSLSVGISYMYYHTTTRTVANDPVAGLPGIDGTFEKGGAHAVNLGAVFKF